MGEGEEERGEEMQESGEWEERNCIVKRERWTVF